ncbi:MAG: hypothetical protein H0V82_01030 [Candidatus Protochlamydia sp.]|nr:hypothetical protein [Candidatus Protochlamydia sp.]
MLSPISQSNPAPSFEKIGQLQAGEVKENSQFMTFTQKVEMGGGKFTVTLYYPKEKTISSEKATSDMELRIGKMMTLANELGLGKEKNLYKIELKNSEVFGKWKDTDGNNKIHEKFETKLQNDLSKSPEAKQEIERKLQVIESAKSTYANAIQTDTNKIEVPVSSKVDGTGIGTVKNQPILTEVQEKKIKFLSAFNSALKVGADLENNEKTKLVSLLAQGASINGQLEHLGKSATPEQLASIKKEMGLFSLKLMEEVNKLQREDSPKLENELVKLVEIYNSVVTERKELEAANKPESKEKIRQLKNLEENMQGKIRDCNSMIGHTSLTTNAFTATKSHVISFQAVVEKKIALMERRIELEALGKGGKELSKIQKELSLAPTAPQMEASYAQIAQKLTKTGINVVSIVDAKIANREHPELKWGASHLNLALTTPANWTEVHSPLIKSSRAGTLYLAVTINTPLNIDARGGVPAGLRSADKYDQRAANLMMTKSYMRTGSDVKIGEQISFRGGQFPTKESAKEALSQMITNMPKGQNLEELHINALLTPIFLTKFKEDKLLLITHKASIEAALNELQNEAYHKEGNVDKAVSLGKLKAQMAISNFGVNEGAVGEMHALGMHIKAQLGWHTSIDDYSNSASQKLNDAAHRKFENIEKKFKDNDLNLSKDLDHLGAILQVGQEMEAVWARNDYAEACVGNNQFKLPSLWKTMDNLLGITCYTDCMSGKDRTGKVESNAQEYQDEITMNIADQKAILTKKFNQMKNGLDVLKLQTWNDMEKTLTSACFHENELDSMLKQLNDSGPERFKSFVNDLVKVKIDAAKEGLGLNSPQGFMQKKEGIPRGFFNSGVNGIPTNIPKIETHKKNQSQFPSLAVSSMYGRKKFNFSGITKADDLIQRRGILVDRQREAVNRRLSQLSGSLQVTQINTSKPGFKVEGGEPLAQFSSGFDRDYVISELLLTNPKSPNFFKVLDNAAGLHELDQATRAEFHTAIHSIATNRILISSRSKQIDAWIGILKKIEDAKMESMAPQAKVKA